MGKKSKKYKKYKSITADVDTADTLLTGENLWHCDCLFLSSEISFFNWDYCLKVGVSSTILRCIYRLSKKLYRIIEFYRYAAEFKHAKYAFFITFTKAPNGETDFRKKIEIDNHDAIASW